MKLEPAQPDSHTHELSREICTGRAVVASLGVRASLEAIASRPDGFGTSAPRWGLLMTTNAAEEQVDAEESLWSAENVTCT